MSSACDGTSPRGLKSRRFLLSVEPAATALGSRAAYVVVALAIGKLLQFQIQLGNTHGFDRPSLAWSALFLALTAPAGIVIHECGHCLAGAALRQHCRRFVIGPVEWARGARGWTVRWIPIRRAGMVDLVPSTFAQFSAAPGDLHCRGPYGLAACGFGFPGPVVGSPHTVSLLDLELLRPVGFSGAPGPGSDPSGGRALRRLPAVGTHPRGRGCRCAAVRPSGGFFRPDTARNA